MKKYKFLTIYFFIFLSTLDITGSPERKNIFFEIKTKLGSFPINIPDLILPKIEKFPLVKVSESNLPELPDWYDSRFVPENPSWLDEAGKFYKEGIESLFLGNMDISFKRFQAIIDEHSETEWFYLSCFWHGQVLAKQNKFLKASESIKFFLDIIISGKKFDHYLEYKDFSIYTLVWLSIKQRKYEEALLIIKKFESEISANKLKNKLHYLKYFSFLKLKKSNTLTFSLLRQGVDQFPYNFEHLVRLAENYYIAKRWQDLSDLITLQSSKSSFYNDSRMEYFYWLGVVAEIELNKLNKARTKLLFLEKLGVRNTDKLALAFFRIYLKERNFENAWIKWTEMKDDILREQSLRELMHNAILSKDFYFLQNKLVKLKPVSRYWKPWQHELELIYAYIYLSTDQNKKAMQWLQWSISHSSKKGKDKSSFIVLEESIFLKTVIDLISFEYKKAFENLKKLLEDFPSSKRLSDYYFWYAVMLYEIEQNHLETIMAIRQVRKDGERDDDRLFILGKINHDLKKWRSAIFHFLSLKNKYPKSIFLEDSLFFQSKAYYEQKRYNDGLESINDLENGYSPLKNSLRAIHLKVSILIALKKFEEADDVLKRRISIQSNLSLIRLRVEVLRHINDPKRILSVTGEGLGLSTNEDEGFLFFHRANALYDIKKYQESIAYYNLANKNPPEGKKRFINFRILKIQSILERIPELINGLEKFLKVNKEDDFSNEILLLVVNYFLDNNKKEKAIPYFKKLLTNYEKSVSKVELSPIKRVEQIFLIGKLYKDFDKLKLSERWLNQGLKSAETLNENKKVWQLSILREKGEVLFYMGKHRQALAASLKVLYLDNTISDKLLYDLNLRIASSYKHLGRISEAQAIYRKMLKNIKTKKKKVKIEELLRNLTK